MAEAKPEPPDAPFGTHPRRSAAPLAVLIVFLVLWSALLVWLAVQYPAR